jgi:hypothetical protein
MSQQLTPKDANDLRLMGHEIMRRLYEDGWTRHLELLRDYAEACLKQIEQTKPKS